MSDAERSRSERIRLERIRDLYGASGPPILAAVIGSAFIAVHAGAWGWRVGDPMGIVAWTAIVVGAETATGVLIHRYHRRHRRDEELGAWALARVAAEALRGAAWALMAALVLAPQEPMSLILIHGTIIGLVAASTAGLAVHKPSMLAFALVSTALSAVFLTARSDNAHEFYSAGLIAVTAVLVVLNGLRMSLIYRQLIETRLDLADAAEDSRRLYEAAETARRLAEEAAAERTRFFGAASHDLRQPVHALGLYVSLLRRNPPPAKRRELIAAIASCVEALDRLFNAILGVSQAIAARDARQAPPAPLQPVIDRTLLQAWPEAERRGLELRARPTAAWARIDATALERVLTNLVSNALRYTERGGVLVAVRRRGPNWELVVADTGLGLAPADQAQVFQPFFRVSGRQNEDDRAYGLGLATVRQICLTQGWRIDLRSRLGRGSVFSVRVPGAQAAPATVEPVPRQGQSPAAEETRGLEVLVVEDDPLASDAIVRLLQSWNARPHLCGDSAGALAILEREDVKGPWFGLFDVRLADSETGLDVADRVRERFPGFPIALITGEIDAEVFAAAEARGLPVLQKPLRPIRLRALLAAHVAPTD